MPSSSSASSPVDAVAAVAAATEHSTAILHSTHNAHKEELLEKIGGSAVLHAAVDEFYTRLTADKRLRRFFEHANLAVLKWHQFNIVSIAFSNTPESYDITNFVLTRHKSLFEAGLNETHYDIVLEHFDATFQHFNVDPDTIAQAKAVVIPLREAFAAGAAAAQQRVISAQRKRTLFFVASVALMAVLAVTGARRLRKKL